MGRFIETLESRHLLSGAADLLDEIETSRAQTVPEITFSLGEATELRRSLVGRYKGKAVKLTFNGNPLPDQVFFASELKKIQINVTSHRKGRVRGNLDWGSYILRDVKTVELKGSAKNDRMVLRGKKIYSVGSLIVKTEKVRVVAKTTQSGKVLTGSFKYIEQGVLGPNTYTGRFSVRQVR